MVGDDVRTARLVGAAPAGAVPGRARRGGAVARASGDGAPARPSSTDAFLRTDGLPRARPWSRAAVVDGQRGAARRAGAGRACALAVVVAMALSGGRWRAGVANAWESGPWPGTTAEARAHHRRHRADVPLPRLHGARAAHGGGHQRRGERAGRHRGGRSRRARTGGGARGDRRQRRGAAAQGGGRPGAERLLRGEEERHLPLRLLRQERASRSTGGAGHRPQRGGGRAAAGGAAHARHGAGGGPGPAGDRSSTRPPTTTAWARLALVFRTPGSQQETRVPLPREDGRRNKGTYTWDLGTPHGEARRPHHLPRRGPGQRRGGGPQEGRQPHPGAAHLQRRRAPPRRAGEGRGALGPAGGPPRGPARGRGPREGEDRGERHRRARRWTPAASSSWRTCAPWPRSCRASAMCPRSSSPRWSTSPTACRQQALRPPRTSAACTCAPRARGEDWGTGTRLTDGGERRNRRDGEAHPLPGVAAGPAEAGGAAGDDRGAQRAAQGPGQPHRAVQGQPHRGGAPAGAAGDPAAARAHQRS